MEPKDIVIYTEGGGGHYHYLRAIFRKKGRPHTDLKVFSLEAKGKSSQVEEIVEEARIVLQVPKSKPGTVHTFQGSEAALVIFDAVLDEPYWSARLTNP